MNANRVSLRKLVPVLVVLLAVCVVVGIPLSHLVRTYFLMLTNHSVKHIGVAVHNYHDDFETLPTSGALTFTPGGRRGWVEGLLPYMDEATLHRQIDLTQPWDAEVNQPAYSKQVSASQGPWWLRSHDAGGYALAHYSGNVLVLGSTKKMTLKDIDDGVSDTILVGQAADSFVPWGSPENLRNAGLGFGSGKEQFGCPVGGLCLFVFGDGSTRAIAETVEPRILKALSTPDGGEDVHGEW